MNANMRYQQCGLCTQYANSSLLPRDVCNDLLLHQFLILSHAKRTWILVRESQTCIQRTMWELAGKRAGIATTQLSGRDQAGQVQLSESA